MRKETIIGLLFLVALSSCKKEEEVPIPFTASFTATIDNQAIIISESNGAIWSCGSGSNSLSTIPDSTNIQFRMFLGHPFKSDGDYRSSLTVTFFNHINSGELIPPGPSGDITEEMFREKLKVGSYPYTFLSETASGVIIEWYDSDGKFWSTGRNQHENNGIPLTAPNYSSSLFEVIDSEPAEVDYPFENWAQKLSMKFNCYVYNNLGDSILIEKGILNCKYIYGFTFNISLNKLAAEAMQAK